MIADNWQAVHAAKVVDLGTAIRAIPPGRRILVGSGAAVPNRLVEGLVEIGTHLADNELVHLMTLGPAPYAQPGLERRFRHTAFFIGPNVRTAVHEGRADFMPVFLSELPALIHSRRLHIDVALVQVSPPDMHGYCTLGTSVDAAKAAADYARLIVAEINEQMPRTHGNTVVPFERITAFIHTDRPLIEHIPEPETDVEARIGEIIADLVEDGSTLQMGIGAIPDAALFRLREKRDLGIHTEMFSDRVVELVEAGAVTNRFKSVHPNRIVTSFVSGTRKLFRFVHDNPLVEFHPCDRTNHTSLIRQNDKVVAINSCLQVDLTGQVCADSIGHRIYSGIGGQMDFIRGAALSRGGKPILAFRSTASGGKISRIAPELNHGAGVVTTRGHVHWMITEYGAVNLHGMTLRERGEALISIAHPDFRAELTRALGAIRHYIVPGLR